jgi:dual 3',5'-cyclic-AMP and -GMP phosphodiesterase 11
VFNGETEEDIRFPMTQGICGLVATTGVSINLANAYDHPNFNQAVDMLTNFKTVSLLCCPIFGDAGKIIGVANMINKTEKEIEPFDEADQKLFEDFAIFCGLALNKAIMHKKMEEQKNRLTLTMELMAFHARVDYSEVDTFKKIQIGLELPMNTLNCWKLCTHNYSDDILAAVTYQMLNTLDYGKCYQILDENLIHYILVVRKNYRPVAYHNFKHAVSVTHCIFYWIMTGMLDPYFSKLELFSLILAALNHDIDHRGTNNQFQKMTNTNLSQFYTKSTMEKHHFNHALGILTSPSDKTNNILVKLTKKDYKDCLDVIETAIIATDLAVFLGNKETFSTILTSKKFDTAGNRTHKYLLIGLLMV